jgi:hypothetical protein
MLFTADAFAPSSLGASQTIRLNQRKDVSRLMDAESPIAELAELAVPAVPATQNLNEIAAAVVPDVDTVSQIVDLGNAVPDLEIIGLVVGQENYGLAVVLIGEAIWSLSQFPSVDHALKTMGPAVVATVILVGVSGPMVTSGNLESVAAGLWIATAVSVLIGMAYLARCLAPFSPSAKEIPAFGIVVAFAGFVSFSQNLIVDGFVTLPKLPTVNLPSFPEIQLPF